MVSSTIFWVFGILDSPGDSDVWESKTLTPPPITNILSLILFFFFLVRGGELRLKTLLPFLEKMMELTLHSCALSIIVNVVANENRVQISVQAVCVSLFLDALRKGMKPSVLFASVIGKYLIVWKIMSDFSLNSLQTHFNGSCINNSYSV